MTKLFHDKKTEVSMSAIFTMLIAMCMVGSYYLQYSSDIYWIKAFTYLVSLIFCGYIFIYSLINKEKQETYASLALLLSIIFALTENIFGILSRADLRIAFEALAIALKGFAAFTIIDALVLKANLIKKWWYILLGVILLFIPAVLKGLPMNIASLSSVFTADHIKIITLTFCGAVSAFGIVALICSVVGVVKKINTFASWSALIYDISVILYGLFGILRVLGVNAEQATRNTALVFELGLILLLISAINLNKSVQKLPAKKRR